MSKRSLFNEIKDSIHAFKEHEQKKITLKTSTIENLDIEDMGINDIKSLRESFNVSRAVFARMLNTRTRTLEKWEQGITKPNDQAVVLMRLVERYPDTIDRIASL